MLSWTNDRRMTFPLAAIFSNHLRAVRRLNTTKSNSQSDKSKRDGNTSAVRQRFPSSKQPRVKSSEIRQPRPQGLLAFQYAKFDYGNTPARQTRVGSLTLKIIVTSVPKGMLRFWLRLWLPLTSMESMEGEVVNSEGYVSWSSFFLRVWERWPNCVRAFRASLRRKGFCASSDYSRINLSPHSHRSQKMLLLSLNMVWIFCPPEKLLTNQNWFANLVQITKHVELHLNPAWNHV